VLTPSRATTRPPLRSTLLPYTTLFRSIGSFDEKSKEYVFNIKQLNNVKSIIQDQEQLNILKDMNKKVKSIGAKRGAKRGVKQGRSEEHTSELQSRENLVCRRLLEKKNR